MQSSFPIVYAWFLPTHDTRSFDLPSISRLIRRVEFSDCRFASSFSLLEPWNRLFCTGRSHQHILCRQDTTKPNRIWFFPASTNRFAANLLFPTPRPVPCFFVSFFLGTHLPPSGLPSLRESSRLLLWWAPCYRRRLLTHRYAFHFLDPKLLLFPCRNNLHFACPFFFWNESGTKASGAVCCTRGTVVQKRLEKKGSKRVSTHEFQICAQVLIRTVAENTVKKHGHVQKE